MEKQPIQMKMAEYQNMISRVNPVAYQNFVDEIKKGVQYLVYNEGRKYQVLLDHSDNPILNEDDRPEGGYPVTGGGRPKGRNGY